MLLPYAATATAVVCFSFEILLKACQHMGDMPVAADASASSMVIMSRGALVVCARHRPLVLQPPSTAAVGRLCIGLACACGSASVRFSTGVRLKVQPSIGNSMDGVVT